MSCETSNEHNDEAIANKLTILNKVIESIVDEKISTLGKLFDLKNSDVQATKSYFKNITIPSLLAHNVDITEDFVEVVENINFVHMQIIPKAIVGHSFLNSLFYTIQIKNEQTKIIPIIFSNKNKNKSTYLQIIPDGLFFLKNFKILANGVPIDLKQIYFHSYIFFLKIKSI